MEEKKNINVKLMLVKEGTKKIQRIKTCTGKIGYQFQDVSHTFSSSGCDRVHVDLAIHVKQKANNKQSTLTDTTIRNLEQAFDGSRKAHPSTHILEQEHYATILSKKDIGKQ